MPAPPLAAKGSTGKGEDLPHLLLIGLSAGLSPAVPKPGASAAQLEIARNARACQ
jgi:hypothetical protein